MSRNQQVLTIEDIYGWLRSIIDIEAVAIDEVTRLMDSLPDTKEYINLKRDLLVITKNSTNSYEKLWNYVGDQISSEIGD